MRHGRRRENQELMQKESRGTFVGKRMEREKEVEVEG